MEPKRKQPIASDKSTAKPPAKPSTKPPTQPPATKSATAACPVGQTVSLLLECKENREEFTPAQMTNTINSLIRHVRKDCSKCASGSIYLLIGVYYFELFKVRLNQFKSLVIDKEFSVINDQEKHDLKNESKNWDDIKIKSCDTFSELITLNSQKKLLEYPVKLINTWSKLREVKQRLNPNLIDQLEVFEILKSCYFIFSFYGATQHTKLTCSIYVELALRHSQAPKQHLLFAYYCQIRFCLDYGLLEKASNCLKISNWLIKSAPENSVKHLVNESYLIKIAECELRLLSSENVEQAAADLKGLINEDYLRSATVVSGYLRCLVYFLLTKFNAKQFPSQDLLQYFNDSYRLTKSLLSKWYPFLSELTPNDKQININTPIWLEFAVTKFIMEFSLTFYTYATNCSIADSHFSFNILVTRLSRIYGSLLWYVQAKQLCHSIYRSICLLGF